MKQISKFSKILGQLLVMMLLFAALPTVQAQSATPITVCVGGTCNYTTIQAAIDAAVAGDTISVYPGNYSETATNRTLLNSGGAYQFGLFFDNAKPGITLQGVKADGTLITNAADVAAKIKTNSTSNFGPDGVFVDADNITITGLEFLDNYNGAIVSNNKTVSVVGNNFTFKYNVVSVLDGGSVYLNDKRIEGYNVSENLFKYGASLDISSGAGLNGSTSGRVIANNTFTADGSTVTRASISFNGFVPSIGWFVDPVGGATINGNSFTGVAIPIRSRGTVEDDFTWASYWTANTFEKAVVAWNTVSDKPRAFDYTSGTYLMNNTIQIGTLIQKEIDHASPGDEVRVAPGTYKGAVLINKPLTLKSTQGPEVTIIHGGDLASDTIYVVSIRASDVTFDGFTVTSPNYDQPGADLTGIMIGYYGDNDLANIVVKNNHVTQIGANNRLVGANDWPSVGIVVDGVIKGLQIMDNKVYDIHQTVSDPTVTWGPSGIGFYGFNTTLLSSDVVISGNEVYNISANVDAPAATISNGIRVGVGSGDGTITGNNIHDIDGRGIAVTSSNNGTVAITNNLVTKSGTGVLMANNLGGTIIGNNLFENSTGIQIDGAANVGIHFNRIFGNTTRGLTNTSSAPVAAENNWWGCNAGPNDSAAKCDTTTNTGTGTITSSPWLILQTLANPTSVDPNAMAAIIANLRTNSANVDTSATGYLVNGLPVAFTTTSTGGMVNPTAAITLNGQATTTFTATAVRGSYEVCSKVDNQTTCAPMTVSNRAPSAVADFYVTNQDNTLTVNVALGVLANDTDPDGDVKTATLVTNVTHGTLSLLGDGSFIYTPVSGFFGTDTFTYQLVTYPAVVAAGGWTDQAVVTITVQPAPPPGPQKTFLLYMPVLNK